MNQNHIIPQSLLIAAIQIIQSATHPNVPYSNVSQVLQALSQLPIIPEQSNGESIATAPDSRGTAE